MPNLVVLDQTVWT